MSILERVFDWGARLDGSTRSLGLLRILVSLIIWVRFADEISLFQATHPFHLSFGLVLLTFTGFVLVGSHTRFALVVVSVGLAFGYVFLGYWNGVPGWYHHHVYLLFAATVLLTFSPCDRSYSIDRVRALREAARSAGPAPAEWGHLWALRLLGLQLSAVYFWAAYDKTDWAWFTGERLEQTLIWVHAGRPLEAWLLWKPSLVTASIAVVLVEYFLSVAIHVRAWQWFVLPLGVGLHAVFYLLLPVDTYSGTMVVLYLAVIDPNAVHRFLDRLQGYATTPRYL